MDTCKICGLNFDSPSFGGPGICAACDCGIQPVEAQRKRIRELEAALRECAQPGSFENYGIAAEKALTLLGLTAETKGEQT